MQRAMSALKRKSNNVQAGSDAKKVKVNSSITSFFKAPKPAANGSAKGAGGAPAPRFDKQKWIAGLTPEQRDLLKLEIETLDDSWLFHLRDDITTKEFFELKKFLKREVASNKTVFPPMQDIYSWSRHTPFHSVKVVILGQDPYHNFNQAHGLAFSVKPPTTAPPSLKNMYLALKRDYPSFVPPPNNGGLLTPWADRGVLLLNTCLTVRAHEANSHANRGWERFTQRVIDVVAAKNTHGVVFMAWGTPASKRVQKIDTVRHLVLRSVHPSPLSASRGFFDCGHFHKANQWLIACHGADADIDWSLGPGTTKAVKPVSAVAADVSAAISHAAADASAASAVADAGAKAAPAPDSVPAATPEKVKADEVVEKVEVTKVTEEATVVAGRDDKTEKPAKDDLEKEADENSKPEEEEVKA